MQFSGTWREYQQRVLDELDAHLTDERLHLIAAPGSGKTVLGLELMRRMERPALILSPTRTIRDQWPARLIPLFMTAPPLPGEVSSDLETPAAMITATYQALHAVWAGEDRGRFARLVDSLHAIGPVTLILDEAHHLRREWWNALQALIEPLPEARVVALTATPPFDAPLAEWNRYSAMCGPVDLEIGVPELVRNGDLCPHQDHVIFSRPDEDAFDLLDRRRAGIAMLQQELRSDAPLLDFFETHPWLTDPEPYSEAILEMPEMLSAILVHLAASGRTLPGKPLALLGVTIGEVQPPSASWLEVLLDGLLFRCASTFPIGEERMKWLRGLLHEYGLIEGGQVRLTESRRLFTLMAGSLAKLTSIVEVARAEAASLGPDLRMVILSDHVRAGELPRAAAEEYKPAKLGVVPVFETLRRAAIAGQRIGILTGNLVILPRTAEAACEALASRFGIGADDLRFTPMPGCPDHLRLELPGGDAHRSVEMVTALFAAGEVTILTGTQALLGEGWDAPAVNSLVLASNSAAFMLSNQMRGRAIRIDPARPDKVANIWHLATVHDLPTSPVAAWGERLNWGRLDQDEAITSDLDLLQRRFRAFEGIANSESTQIESGIERLCLYGHPGLEAANARTLALARDRPAIADAWRRSLGQAPPRAHVRETASPNYAPRQLSWHDTLLWLGASAVSGGAFAAANVMRSATSLTGLGTLGMALAGALAVASLPKLIKSGWLAYRNGSLEGSLDQVGRVVLASLHASGLISTDEFQGAYLEVRCRLSGRYDLVLHNVTRSTERTVMEAIAEILGPIGNPRYLLARTSWLGPRQRIDYHAAPTAIARRKEWAEDFHRRWKAGIGSSRLIFTRTPEGRIALLRARARSFAAGFQRRVDRRSAWL